MKGRLPGIIATGLVIVTTSLWTFWGTAEMYYEGWGNPFPSPLVYLIPCGVCLLLSLMVVIWPFVGGLLLIVVGSLFTLWWFSVSVSRGAPLLGLLSMFPVSGMLVVTGVLFIFEARYRARRSASEWTPPEKWLRRNFRYVAVVGVPLLVLFITTAFFLPPILTRLDDGDRGARVIEGNGVTLMWAPLGPGWNWKQPWGGHPSWNRIARYGVRPIGIDNEKPGYEGKDATVEDMAATSVCRYLSKDGLTLMDEPQNIWRMPSVHEIVRSLPLHGENAGCAWGGREGRVECSVWPDKETPLWAPDQQPIYYWAGDEASDREGYYVSYNGRVQAQPKTWGNPRHGYRCVRELPGSSNEAQTTGTRLVH